MPVEPLQAFIGRFEIALPFGWRNGVVPGQQGVGMQPDPDSDGHEAAALSRSYRLIAPERLVTIVE
jgi:hypothetical protein